MDIERAIKNEKLWGTKSLSFWTMLSLILIKTKPKNILEIGSGRSTTILADYAYTHNANLISIEESWEWQTKISDDLICMCLPTDYIKHVPITNGWYDRNIFDSEVRGRQYDLVFVDGPCGESARAHKDNMGILDICITSNILIIDDVHRPSGKEFQNMITAKGKHTEIITIPYRQRQYARKMCDKIVTVDNEISFICNNNEALIINQCAATAGVTNISHRSNG
jgi:hypothetical protein